MEANVARTQHDRLVWAAYALGRHPWLLWQWQSALWGVRVEAAEGRIRVGAEPPAEIDELADAISLVARSKLPDPECAALLAGAAARLKHAGTDMLRELRHPWHEDSDADWDESLPDGVQHTATIWTAAERAFTRDGHLEQWRKLGQWLYELGISVTCLQGEDARELCARLRILNRSDDYPIVERMCRAIEGSGYRPEAREDVAQLVDPIFKRITVGRVESVLRGYLRDGARPQPWITLSRESVRFLGKDWPAHTFRPAELGILWVLCERPRERVTCESLIRAVNLDCKPQDVKPHVSRLKKTLRAGQPRLSSGDVGVPEGANECFIKGHAGAYELQLDVTRVLVLPPRPTFMPGTGTAG